MNLVRRNHMAWLIITVVASCLVFRSVGQSIDSTEVLVVGGGTGGIAAALQSGRMGVKTLIVEQTHMLGGMLTAAGVSCTDGNHLLQSGIWEDFRRALYTHYGSRDLATGWVSETCFEPHVGDSIFKAMAAAEKNIRIVYGWYFDQSRIESNKVVGVDFVNQKGEKLTVRARITIDATELGDVFANAGVTFDVGTEDATYSGEKMAPGKTNIIQDITWAAVLTDKGNSPKILQPPSGYHEEDYYCSCTSAPCNAKSYPADAAKMLEYGKLPNNKYMVNWPAHGNDFYINLIDKNPMDREGEYLAAKRHTEGFVYFIQTTLGLSNFHFANDELDSGMAVIPYNREGRRMRGIVRFTVNDVLAPFTQADALYRTGIAVGDYPVDHHHGQNPDAPKIHFPKIPSFNIPLGALIPQAIDGLLVCEKGISVSNIMNGATRLQPVVLLTGQAAGAVAAISIHENQQPRAINVRKTQSALLDAGCYLMPYNDVLPSSPWWKPVQRIGVTGILMGDGQPSGWENKTWFYPDSMISPGTFYYGLLHFDPACQQIKSFSDKLLTIGKAIAIIRLNAKQLSLSPIGMFEKEITAKQQKIFWEENLGLKNFSLSRNIKRYELAVLLDRCTGAFAKSPDLRGHWIQ